MISLAHDSRTPSTAVPGSRGTSLGIRLLVVAAFCGGFADAATAADTGGAATAPLTVEQASELVSTSDGVIALDSLGSLTPEAALQLSVHDHGLSLDGLASLDAATARVLAMHGRMEGVDPNSLDSDAILAKLDGLYAEGGDGEVNLDGLLDGIESLLADLDANTDGADSEESDPWLSLGGVKALSPDVAAALAMHDGPLLLDGLTVLSPDVAGSLATHSGELSLTGLESLSDEARAALAMHDGPVVLPDALVTASGGE